MYVNVVCCIYNIYRMTWFSIAIFAPILWAVVNHADKFLLSKLSHKASVAGLMMFSTLFSTLVIIGLLIFKPDIVYIQITAGVVSILGGILNATSIYFYLLALEKDEASIVVPFFQLMPVFALLLGFLMLGETITHTQFGGILLIIFGALFLSIEITRENKFTLRKGVAFLMICSSFILAFQDVIFKLKAEQTSFWSTLFWTHMGLIIFGIILSLNKNNRKNFFDIIRRNSATVFGVNIGSELLTTFGNAIINYASLLAPIGIVLSIYGYQPLAVFVLGVVATLFFPRIAEEKMHIGAIAQKIFGIAIIFVGTLLLG